MGLVDHDILLSQLIEFDTGEGNTIKKPSNDNPAVFFCSRQKSLMNMNRFDVHSRQVYVTGAKKNSSPTYQS